MSDDNTEVEPVGETNTSPEPSLAQYKFDNPIPKAVRNYGKVIDPSLLEPGDLILVCHKNPPWISRKIQQYQSELYHWAHARWHHVLVSGGEVEICEARLRGVIAREYWPYMTGDYELKIRRIREAQPAERAKVAYYAATMVGMSYGFLNILRIVSAVASGNFRQRVVFQSRGVICSQLYFEACMRVGVLLSTTVSPDRVTPSHLSASGQMKDIPLRWVKL